MIGRVRIPEDAGAVLVDLREVGHLLRGRRGKIIGIVVVVLIALMVIGDPTTWPLPALLGFTTAVTWLLLRSIRMVLAVCEHGVVVRRFRAAFVPWASVRGVRSRWRAGRGSRYRQILIETDDAPAQLPRALGRHDDNNRVADAIAQIEQHADVKLQHADGRG
jgi:hypothetical protein